jgi:hypothetical protein
MMCIAFEHKIGGEMYQPTTLALAGICQSLHGIYVERICFGLMQLTVIGRRKCRSVDDHIRPNVIEQLRDIGLDSDIRLSELVMPRVRQYIAMERTTCHDACRVGYQFIQDVSAGESVGSDNKYSSFH